MSEERYFVRVQLVKSDREGEYISKSFDYEVSPTISIHQDPLFMRAEKFYSDLQTILKASGGVVKVTDKENLRGSK